MGAQGSGRLKAVIPGFEDAIKYYTETYCEVKDLEKLFSLTPSQAKRASDQGLDIIKHRRKMEKIIESGMVFLDGQIEEF